LIPWEKLQEQSGVLLPLEKNNLNGKKSIGSRPEQGSLPSTTHFLYQHFWTDDKGRKRCSRRKSRLGASVMSLK